MSLYNMLLGANQLSPVLLEILDMGPNGEYSNGRFRDIELVEDGAQIMLYTRDGGGNRDFAPDWSKHPNYLYDEDDDFDCTYCYIYFSVPEEYKELCAFLASESTEPPQTVSEKFEELISRLKED